jgi:hypothetical protein
MSVKVRAQPLFRYMAKPVLKEPVSFRISDDENPHRCDQVSAILERKGAMLSKVLRQLLDAYIRSGGGLDFPVDLVPVRGHRK